MWVMRVFEFRTPCLSLSLSLTLSLSLFLSLSFGVLSLLVSSAFFWSAPLSRNLSFISFFSSDRIRLDFFKCFFFFLPRRSWIGRKLLLIFFFFFDKFHRHFAKRWSYEQKTPFFSFWRNSRHRSHLVNVLMGASCNYCFVGSIN